MIHPPTVFIDIIIEYTSVNVEVDFCAPFCTKYIDRIGWCVYAKNENLPVSFYEHILCDSTSSYINKID
jgi:hypothetical protein